MKTLPHEVKSRKREISNSQIFSNSIFSSPPKIKKKFLKSQTKKSFLKAPKESFLFFACPSPRMSSTGATNSNSLTQNDSHEKTSSLSPLISTKKRPKRESGKLSSYEEEKMKQLEDSARNILKAIGENPEREGLKNTPSRFSEAMMYFTNGYELDLQGHFLSKPSFFFLFDRF